MIFDLKRFSIAYIVLTVLAAALSFSSHIETDALWVAAGGFGFLAVILSLAFVVRVLLLNGTQQSKPAAIVVILLKLPLLVLVSYVVAQAGIRATVSFIVGTFLFIPALVISSLIRYVKTGT